MVSTPTFLLLAFSSLFFDSLVLTYRMSTLASFLFHPHLKIMFRRQLDRRNMYRKALFMLCTWLVRASALPSISLSAKALELEQRSLGLAQPRRGAPAAVPEVERWCSVVPGAIHWQHFKVVSNHDGSHTWSQEQGSV